MFDYIDYTCVLVFAPWNVDHRVSTQQTDIESLTFSVPFCPFCHCLLGCCYYFLKNEIHLCAFFCTFLYLLTLHVGLETYVVITFWRVKFTVSSYTCIMWILFGNVCSRHSISISLCCTLVEWHCDCHDVLSWCSVAMPILGNVAMNAYGIWCGKTWLAQWLSQYFEMMFCCLANSG